MSAKVERRDIPWDEQSQIIETMWDRKQYTPDFHIFRERDYTPFFVYEPLLKQGGKHNGVLLPSESKYLGKAHTLNDHYIVKTARDSIPYERSVAFIQDVKKARSFDKAHIRGECYALSPRAVLNLDRYMHNENEFFRFERSFFLSDQESPYKSLAFPSMKLWVYIGVPTYWSHFKLETHAWMKDHMKEKWFWA